MSSNPLEVINLLIPYMQPAEQRTASRYLYNQRAADDTISNWLSGYNVTQRRCASQPAQLPARHQPRRQPPACQSMTLNNPAANWLTSVLGLGRNLRPGMSRVRTTGLAQRVRNPPGRGTIRKPQQAVSYVYNPTLSDQSTARQRCSAVTPNRTASRWARR
jgi:hypothetical protein